MNDIYSGDQKGLDVFLIDDVGDGSIDKATKMLAGISRGVEKAVGSAIKRAATSGEAFAARAVRDEYYVNASDFKEYTKSSRHIITDKSGTTVDIEFHGHHIPLLKFDTHIGKDGHIVARVKRSSVRTTLEKAFAQSVGAHTGIFEREGDERLPIRELFGPSTPQMMSYNDDLEQAIGDHVRETFDKRLEHEVNAILNGWRR